MDPIWLICAFAFGYLVKRVNLPPLVGFLLAGFCLNLLGVENKGYLDEIADLGVLLLLFTIGLKLKVKNLFYPQIWLTTSLHMMITIFIFSGIIWALASFGLFRFTDLGAYQILLISFALSFSSTIFAVKILEETGTSKSTHGRVAIGILIMQDLFAVVFLSATSDQLPSPWAFALLLLLFVPWLIKKTKISSLLDESGHGELFLLLGVMIPLAGASLFYATGLKPDLGAVVFGVLLAGHPRAGEMAKAMMGFKDLFLIGFFLSIGLEGIPNLYQIGIAFMLSLLLPIKIILFFVILTRLKLRARTSFFTTLSLANYSEFGLIVGAAAIAKDWLPSGWMVVFALSLSFTFILASTFNLYAARIYVVLQKYLLPFESEKRLEEDEPIEFSKEEVIVFGMGRTGNKVYEVLSEKYGLFVLGIDQNHDMIEQLETQGKHVIQGDAMDLNFWQRINLTDNPPSIVLATSSHVTHMNVIDQLKELDCQVKIAALSRFQDELQELQESGVPIVFNLYEEAGVGFAEHTFQSIYNSKS